MIDLYDALEDCLEDMTRGASLEHALRRYPAQAQALRPLLEAAVLARASSQTDISAEIRKRGRARVLQRSHEMEESKAGRRARFIPVFPRIAITAVLSMALLLTSTGLVSASSASLPGENLYPVKRTWESVRLLFVFSPQERDLLESGYEQERLDEIYELLGRRMSAPITFSGVLAKRLDGTWTISGIPVAVGADTTLPAVPLADGAPLSVTGLTGANGVVQAHRIDVLSPGVSLPPLEPSEGAESEMRIPGEGTEPSTPQAPAPTSQPATTRSAPQPEQTYQFTGVVQSMQGNTWRINGQTVYMDGAQVSGKVGIGSTVQFQGYYASDGRFVVTSLQARNADSTNQKKNDGSDGGSDGESEGGGGGSDGGGGEP